MRTLHPGREQFRLFCILDKADDEANRLPRDAIAVIDGGRKPNAALFDAAFYARVRKKGDDYEAQLPRRIAT